MLTDTDIRRFLKRTLRLLFWGVVVLSVALNIFLLVPKPAGTLQKDDTTEEVVSMPSRWSYGKVVHAIPPSTQQGEVIRTILPASRYDVPSGMLPALADEMAVYRDEGLPLDITSLKTLADALRLPLDIEALAVHPSLYEWTSSDGNRLVSIDIENRALSLREKNRGSVASEPADDRLTIDLAKDYVAGFGIVLPVADEPSIIESDNGTWVRWPMRWNGFPLLDRGGQVHYGIQVIVDRATRTAWALELSLYSPDALGVSDYPIATKDALTKLLLSGGLVPLPVDPKKKAAPVSYTSMDAVYILSRDAERRETYILPAVRGFWISSQTCKDCAPVLFSTFVPALDIEQFDWRK